MYLGNIILSVINMNTWNTKRHFSTLIHAKKQGRRVSKWKKPHRAVTRDQPKARQAKAVAIDGGQGLATPRGRSLPLDATLPLLAVVVACCHAEAVQLGV